MLAVSLLQNTLLFIAGWAVFGMRFGPESWSAPARQAALAPLLGCVSVAAASIVAKVARDATIRPMAAAANRPLPWIPLGATRVANLAREIEMAGKSNVLDSCPALLMALNAEYAAAQRLLKAALPVQP